MPPNPAISLDKRKTTTTPESQTDPLQSVRETVESIVVAFILAFLFRAFVAEAFVIPTGSMAPTLMGAHKDIVCEHCGQQYQTGASNEFESDTGRRTGHTVVASTCANCRGLNAFDLGNNANHATFSGDRILVSKFDYVLHNPTRWDVIVFKYPLSARMNYIKRLVGLPGEQLRIQGGDVYVREEDSQPWTIARKPPHKINAMRQIVSDTQFQPELLVASGWPSLWQPWSGNSAGATGDESSWKLEHSPTGWSAELSPSKSTEWIRYYHKFLTDTEWEDFEANATLPDLDPRSSRLVTDFQAYNTAFSTSRDQVYDARGKLKLAVQDNVRPYNQLSPTEMWADLPYTSLAASKPLNDGEHWVGDLIGEYVVKLQSDAGLLSLMLVENGIEFRCDLDVATGKATLQALDAGETVPIFQNGAKQLTAETPLRGVGDYRLQIANFDDQIVVWVNGKVIQFSGSTEYDLSSVRSEEARRPHWTESNPLDAAPVAIGGQSVAMKVERAKVWRDIYYIAISDRQYSDFDLSHPMEIIGALPPGTERSDISSQAMGDQDLSRLAISSLYANPQWWSATSLFSMRNEIYFKLDGDHYFPMGDNSAASLDARAWIDNSGIPHKYVEHRYLLGKALLVFWPHYWYRPIPYFPNFSRMGLIR